MNRWWRWALVTLALILLSGHAAPSLRAEETSTESAPVSRRAYPFRSTVFSFDPGSRSLRIGKKRIRLLNIVPETRLIHELDGTEATVEDLIIGTEIRGSYRKRADGELEAITIRIGARELKPT